MNLTLLFVAALSVLPAQATAAERQVSVSVPTMDCPVCPLTIMKALARVPGVRDVKVNFEQRAAVVSFDDGLTGVDQLMRATRDSGCPSVLKEGKP